MVHWVYVLECEDGYIYVGETSRLYKRLNEHISGGGSSVTRDHMPIRLVGLYKVYDNYSYIRYRTIGDDALQSWGQCDPIGQGDSEIKSINLLIEDHITERYIYDRLIASLQNKNDEDIWDSGDGDETWYHVSGGKYVRRMRDLAISYDWVNTPAANVPFKHVSCQNPLNEASVEDIMDRPLCKCERPSEVKLSKNRKTIYFVCATKNIWENFYKRNGFGVNQPCDFWQPYALWKNVCTVTYPTQISETRTFESCTL